MSCSLLLNVAIFYDVKLAKVKTSMMNEYEVEIIKEVRHKSSNIVKPPKDKKRVLKKKEMTRISKEMILMMIV